MLRPTLLLSVGLLLSSLHAREISQNHIDGALQGAALGDALGRVTTALDTQGEIDYVYGHQGIATVNQYVDGDWVVDAQGKKVAPYASNTVLSLLALDVVSHARSTKKTKEQMADAIASGLVTALGKDYRAWDPQFDQRYHMLETLKKAEQVAQRQAQSSAKPWWTDGDEDTLSHELLALETDAGALTRVWPVALVYADNKATARYYADYLTTITHRHATARAASSALVTGIIHALQGDSVDTIVTQMTEAAEKFDRLERCQKRKSRKIWSRNHFRPELVAKDRMLTSDMIRYAAYAATNGISPEKFLGTTSKKKDNGRSFRGYLLGYNADEAVAAAVYLFIRNQDDFRALAVEGSLAGGNASLITSLAGALYGAYNGLDALKENGYASDLAKLEGSKKLRTAGATVQKSLAVPAILVKTNSANRDFEESIEAYHHELRFSSWFTARKLLTLAIIGVGIYALWHNWETVKPYYDLYLEPYVTPVTEKVVQKATAVKAWCTARWSGN